MKIIEGQCSYSASNPSWRKVGIEVALRDMLKVIIKDNLYEVYSETTDYKNDTVVLKIRLNIVEP